MSLHTCYRTGSRQNRPGWPGWAIGFDYDAEIVTRLKATIPGSDREWWEQDRLWWVAEHHEDTLAEIFPDFYRDQPELPSMEAAPDPDRAERDIKDLWG